MWMDVKYEPGTLKVVAFDKQGKPVAEKEIRTAGKPHHLEISADKTSLTADGKDLSYITVSVVDKDGNLCPNATNQLNFKVTGAGSFRAVCNGDATSLEMFHLPTMKAFSGKLVVLVQSTENEGDIKLEIESKGLKKASLSIKSL
jgi:beta-galactosidase